MSVVAPVKPRATATHARGPEESRDPAPFPRYPKYKDSCVAWLGEVPSPWEIKPIKAVASCNDDVLAESTDPADEIVYLEISGVSPDKGITETQTLAFGAAPSRARRRVRDGDVLVSTVRTYLRAIAPLSDPPENMIASTGFAVIRPRAVNSVFLGYLFRSEFLVAAIIARSVGVSYPAINASDLMRLSIPVPRMDEQSAIATFLDRETAKSDALIVEQEKLIALLKEKRQALISHAVTKGLDPDASMKDSGIEWLGQMPAHWEMRTISSLSTKITNGYVGPTRNILVDDGVRYLQSLHIKNNSIRFDTPYFVRPGWSNTHAKSILATGDVLIVQTGDIGQVAVVTDEFAGCNCHALIIVAPVSKVVAGPYLSLALNSAYGFHSLLSIQTGALHPHLNCGNVKDVLIPVPPMSEQRRIIDFVEHQTCTLQELLTEVERAIELLKERRATLISAAVTGKIDVRHVA